MCEGRRGRMGGGGRNTESRRGGRRRLISRSQLEGKSTRNQEGGERREVERNLERREEVAGGRITRTG